MADTSALTQQLEKSNANLAGLRSQLQSSTTGAQFAYSAYDEAKNAPNTGVYILNGQTFNNKSEYVSAAESQFNSAAASRKQVAEQYNAELANNKSLQTQIATAAATPDTGITPTPVTTESPTTPDASAAASAAKMENSEIVGGTLTNNQDQQITEYSATGKATYNFDYNSPRGVDGVNPGAEISSQQPPVVTIRDSRGNVKKPDLRVKIRVPTTYLTDDFTNSLAGIGGVLFPYTPSIEFEHKADYATQTPLHSNFALNFYKSSSVSPISITGKFTVQNDKDAIFYLSTVHLLRALTKMRFGNDRNAGSPPPVCRLDAYGTFMLQNVPVAISSFKNSLPNNVDFYTLGKEFTSKYGSEISVPTISEIQVTCLPMYSRDEMRKFTVTDWLSNAATKKKGYL